MNLLAALALALTPWTLAHARQTLATSTYAIVDVSQQDHPQYLLQFTKQQARSLRKVKSRFVYNGIAHDGYTDADIAVHFVLTRDNQLNEFAGPAADLSQPSFPIRGTFYYAWYPEAWRRGNVYPFTLFHPSLDYYSSDSASVVQEQTQAMLYAHFNTGIYSYWRQGGYAPTGERFWRFLAAARTTPLRWALYYEAEGYGNPSVAKIHSDLEAFRDLYAVAPAYLKVDGRFVVFVYGGREDNCSTVERWRAANAGINAYLVLMVFPGYRECAAQPDAWHHYEPATPAYSAAPDSFMISPAFDGRLDPQPRLPRDLARWKQDIAEMVASNAKWQLVETFNEWQEGTSVESAREWATPSGFGAYLDALHEGLP